MCLKRLQVVLLSLKGVLMYTITLSNELVNHDLGEVIFSSKKLVARDVITLPTVIPLYSWKLKTAKIVRIVFC